jgi:predicted amidophosphoribosyltransferase
MYDSAQPLDILCKVEHLCMIPECLDCSRSFDPANAICKVCLSLNFDTFGCHSMELLKNGGFEECALVTPHSSPISGTILIQANLHA